MDACAAELIEAAPQLPCGSGIPTAPGPYGRPRGDRQCFPSIVTPPHAGSPDDRHHVLLVIFFMIFGTFRTETAGVPLELPRAATAQDLARDHLVITVTRAL